MFPKVKVEIWSFLNNSRTFWLFFQNGIFTSLYRVLFVVMFFFWQDDRPISKWQATTNVLNVKPVWFFWPWSITRPKKTLKLWNFIFKKQSSFTLTQRVYRNKYRDRNAPKHRRQFNVYWPNLMRVVLSQHLRLCGKCWRCMFFRTKCERYEK